MEENKLTYWNGVEITEDKKQSVVNEIKEAYCREDDNLVNDKLEFIEGDMDNNVTVEFDCEKVTITADDPKVCMEIFNIVEIALNC